jgi:SPX domain protein involved in polyphosphate accumulation
MQVKRELNIYTLFPIASFLLLQTFAIIWWAANVTTDVGSVQEDIGAVKEALEEEASNRTIERQRIYDRLTLTERTVNEIIANERATAAVLKNLQDAILQTREDVKETNELLREVLLTIGATNGDQTRP